MQLGEFYFKTPVCSAPMAGVTDKAYRVLAREAGCDLIWTEMISATALTYKNSKTFQMLDVSQESQPLVVQLFGSEPKVMAEAAKIAVANGARILDINMGCPATKVVKNCEGSALLKDLPRAQSIASAVVQAVEVPVTVKFRLGWDAATPVGIELAQLLEEVGVAALVVHGRTREQFYAGQADWREIAKIKKAVNIPVIANGDIWKPEDAKEMLEVTGCDGVMIGRGSLGNPWIFTRTVHYLASGDLLPGPTPEDKIKVALKHMQLLIRYKGEKVAIQEMRKHAAWYIKGLHDAARIRDLIMTAKEPCEMGAILEGYAASLQTSGA